MKKLRKHKGSFEVKTGTVDKFFEDIKTTMRAADRGEPLEERHTLIFEDPLEMLNFLSKAKIELIKIIRAHPDSITNIAKTLKRNRAAVYRDISKMEEFGLVKLREEVNPGHGRHKIVEVVAPAFKLEAYL